MKIYEKIFLYALLVSFLGLQYYSTYAITNAIHELDITLYSGKLRTGSIEVIDNYTYEIYKEIEKMTSRFE